MGRAEQIAKNELAFRRLNEEIERLSERWRHETMDAFCECGDPSCHEHLLISPSQYRQIRDDRHFLVCEGHEIPAVERVVDRRQAFVVVEKPEDATKLARRAVDTASSSAER
jgi:hypothetical protein